MKIDESWYKRFPGLPEHVSGGGVVVRLENGRVYVALTREEDYVEYVLPKGHVEEGENLKQAARREIEEETGLTNLNFLGKLDVRARLNFVKTSWKKTHYFLFSTDQVEATPTDSKHHQGITWFPIDELPSIFWPEQKELIKTNRDKIVELLKRAGEKVCFFKKASAVKWAGE